MKEDLNALKRAEYITDIVTDVKPVITNILVSLWETVYKNTTIPKRHWLQRFQLSLKNIASYEEDVFYKYVHQNGGKRKHVLDNIFEVYVLTALIYHNSMTLRLKKDMGLLATFLKQTALQSAREVWHRPEVLFNVTHKKDLVVEARDMLDKIIVSSIKFVLRSQVKELIATQEDIIEKQTPYIDIDGAASFSSGDSDYGLGNNAGVADIVIGNEHGDDTRGNSEGAMERFVDEEKVVADVARSRPASPAMSRQSSLSSSAASSISGEPEQIVYGYRESRPPSPHHRPPQSMDRPISRCSSMSSIKSAKEHENDEIRRSFEDKFMVTLDDSNRIVPFDSAIAPSRPDSVKDFHNEIDIDNHHIQIEQEGKYHESPATIHPSSTLETYEPIMSKSPRVSRSPSQSSVHSYKKIELNLTPATEKLVQAMSTSKHDDPEFHEKKLRYSEIKEKKKRVKTSLDVYSDYYNNTNRKTEFNKPKYFYKK